MYLETVNDVCDAIPERDANILRLPLHLFLLNECIEIMLSKEYQPSRDDLTSKSAKPLPIPHHLQVSKIHSSSSQEGKA